METKINDQIKDSLKNERDTYYILGQDFYKEVDGITEKEDELAKKFRSLIGSNIHDEEEIIICVEPIHLFNFLVRLQREILKVK